ncbi:MAG: DNA cytosine methyltransferase [Alphaproteobacteria bacterium]|nr:DNA cytosine methyltransferase [Alphaproteobacteria bacterium]
MRSLTTIGLFASIGGIELGLARAGHRCRLLCEIDPGAQAVLSTRFPDVETIGDVRMRAGAADRRVPGMRRCSSKSCMWTSELACRVQQGQRSG